MQRGVAIADYRQEMRLNPTSEEARDLLVRLGATP